MRASALRALLRRIWPHAADDRRDRAAGHSVLLAMFENRPLAPLGIAHRTLHDAPDRVHAVEFDARKRFRLAHRYGAGQEQHPHPVRSPGFGELFELGVAQGFAPVQLGDRGAAARLVERKDVAETAGAGHDQR